MLTEEDIISKRHKHSKYKYDKSEYISIANFKYDSIKQGKQIRSRINQLENYFY